MSSEIYINVPLRFLARFKGRLDALSKFVDEGLRPEVSISPPAILKLDIPFIFELSRLFMEMGIKPTVHGPFIDLNPGAVDPEVREVTRRRFDICLSVARILMAEVVVLHASFDVKRYGHTLDEWTRRAVETFLSLEHNGLKIAIENTFEETPEPISMLLDKLPENFGACIDVGHITAFGNNDIEGWISVLGSRTFEIHIHDTKEKEDLHLIPGGGIINFEPVVEFYRSKKPILCLEPHDFFLVDEFVARTRKIFDIRDTTRATRT